MEGSVERVERGLESLFRFGCDRGEVVKFEEWVLENGEWLSEE